MEEEDVPKISIQIPDGVFNIITYLFFNFLIFFISRIDLIFILFLIFQDDLKEDDYGDEVDEVWDPRSDTSEITSPTNFLSVEQRNLMIRRISSGL